MARRPMFPPHRFHSSRCPSCGQPQHRLVGGHASNTFSSAWKKNSKGWAMKVKNTSLTSQVTFRHLLPEPATDIWERWDSPASYEVHLGPWMASGGFWLMAGTLWLVSALFPFKDLYRKLYHGRYCNDLDLFRIKRACNTAFDPVWST